MLIPLTTESILFSLAIGSATFAVYRSFREPDVLADKEIAVMETRLVFIHDSIVKILNNDLPHLDAKIEDIHSDVAQLRVLVTQLATIIEERIPKR